MTGVRKRRGREHVTASLTGALLERRTLVCGERTRKTSSNHVHRSFPKLRFGQQLHWSRPESDYAQGGPSVREVLDTAREAASAGARVLLERIEDHGDRRSKSSPTDFVTDADIASGVAVVNAILKRHSDARFVIEEEEVYDLAPAPRGALDDAEVWVVDPLDGTTSYIHGFPCYSVSVALLRAGQPVAGAVFDVARRELYSAAQGLGAHRDERRLRVATAESVNAALLVTGFPYDRGEPLDRQLAVLAAFLRAPVHGIRRDGSAAIDCCHVAAGRADGFWEYTLKPWDMAGGVIVLREAGAQVTDAAGKPWKAHSDSICAANPTLQPLMLDVIARATGG